MNPIFWQAFSFSGVAFVIVASLTWWLFYSPVRKATKKTENITPAFSATIGLLLIFGALLLMGGAFWDASMHIRTGEIPAGTDFLWPPHIMIYSSFTLWLVVGLFSLGKVAIDAGKRGVKGLRVLLRKAPSLGALALASLYVLLSLPGDAIWHELFGVDLTAWSPPHLIIGLMSCTVIICATGVLLESRKNYQRPTQADLLLVTLLAMLLSVAYMVGVIEWELPGNLDSLVAARQQWLYPLVAGSIGFFVLKLGKKLVPWRWTAVAIAGIAFFVRLAYSFILGATGNITPALPLIFLGGAFLLDVFQNVARSSAKANNLWMAFIFSFSFASTSLLQIAAKPEAASFSQTDQAATFGGLLLVCLIVSPVTEKVSNILEN